MTFKTVEETVLNPIAKFSKISGTYIIYKRISLRKNTLFLGKNSGILNVNYV